MKGQEMCIPFNFYPSLDPISLPLVKSFIQFSGLVLQPILKTSTLLFLLVFSLALHAQKDPVTVNLPLAPTAAGIAKYGDIPVSESTGIPSIGVPVTSLNHRGLSINVSLSYHAGGIRVSDEASWVGLGWSISGGGMITRAIRGHDDFAPRSPTPASRQPVLGYS